MATLHLCLGAAGRSCSRLTEGRRCRGCARAHGTARTKAKRAVRPYPKAEQVRRAKAVAEHRALHGEVCPGWGDRPAHTVRPPNILTADHVIPVALGGAEDGEHVVRCRLCNSAKAARSSG